VVFISSVNSSPLVLVIAAGTCDAGGFFTMPPLSVPAGLDAGTVGFRTATLSAPLELLIGNEVPVLFR